MVIGTVREIKDNAYRVGLVPGGAKALVGDNHATPMSEVAAVRALRTDASLLPGINTYQGKLTIGPVGEALGLPPTDIRTLLPA